LGDPGVDGRIILRWIEEMGWACRTYRAVERLIQDFGRETCGKENTWETQA